MEARCEIELPSNPKLAVNPNFQFISTSAAEVAAEEKVNSIIRIMRSEMERGFPMADQHDAEIQRAADLAANPNLRRGSTSVSEVAGNAILLPFWK